MNKPKIIFMGSSDFAVPALELLAKDYEIPLVVVQPDKKRGRGNKMTPLPVKQKALELGLNVFQPENISLKENEEYLKGFNPDLFVVCAYGQILKDNILEIPKYGSLNIHGSLLPNLRGAAPVHRAIIEGFDKTGISIMLLDSGMDTGPVLATSEVSIDNKTTVGNLHDKLALIGADKLLEVIPLYLNEELKPIDQDNTKASYAQKIDKKEAEIDLNTFSDFVLRKINGLDPFPGAFLKINGQKVKIFNPVLTDETRPDQSNTIFEEGKSIKLVCGDGKVLRIDEIQFPGKKRMKVEDFLRGNHLPSPIHLD